MVSDIYTGDFAYVPSAAEGTVSAFGLTDRRVVWTKTVSGGSGEKGEAAHGIAASLDGKYVYAGDATAKQLVVLDGKSGEELDRIQINHGVHAIDISPDGNYVWVGGPLEGYYWLSALSVVNTKTNKTESVISPGVGDASHIALTPDGGEVWVASVTNNILWIVDASEREVISVIPLISDHTLTPQSPESPEGILGFIGFNEVAISPDGAAAYAVGPESSMVYGIDVQTRTVFGTKKAGERAHGISVSPDGNEVWIANRSGTVTVMDTATLSVVETIPLGEYANHVAFSPDGSTAFVSRQDDIAVISVRGKEVVDSIPVGKEPHEISLEDL